MHYGNLLPEILIAAAISKLGTVDILAIMNAYPTRYHLIQLLNTETVLEKG